jgi:hypothetical protein
MKTPLPAVVTVLSVLESMFVVPRLQAQNPSGTIRGVVQDVSGSRISSASNVLYATSASFERGRVSDAPEGFRVDDLPLGTYDVIVGRLRDSKMLGPR